MISSTRNCGGKLTLGPTSQRYPHATGIHSINYSRFGNNVINLPEISRNNMLDVGST